MYSQQNLKLIGILLLMISMPGCSYIFFWESDDQQEQVSNDEGDDQEEADEVDPDELAEAKVENMQLKQAQLWSRIDELESHVLSQQERVRVLEQGLMLGVVPDALKSRSAGKHPNETHTAGSGSIGIVPMTPKKKAPTKVDKEAYRESLAEARELFQSGHYGKAYLKFAELDKAFPANITAGEPRYWLGRSWYRLKEYESAKKILSSFTKEFPSSPWVPTAHYYLAKSEFELGLKDIAVTHLQQLIKEHPYEGAAEAARQLLADMQRAL